MQSPIFEDDIYVVIKCKNGSDGAPAVSYFVQLTGENASIPMEALPAPRKHIHGTFQDDRKRAITFQVAGLKGGSALQTLQFAYTLVD